MSGSTRVCQTLAPTEKCSNMLAAIETIQKHPALARVKLWLQDRSVSWQSLSLTTMSLHQHFPGPKPESRRPDVYPKFCPQIVRQFTNSHQPCLPSKSRVHTSSYCTASITATSTQSTLLWQCQKYRGATPKTYSSVVYCPSPTFTEQHGQPNQT